MKIIKRFLVFILLGLIFVIFINLRNGKKNESTVERISVDRYVLENQNNNILFISNVTIEPNIDLHDEKIMSKVFDEIKYFISTETTSPLGSIYIMDVERGLSLLVDKESKLIYFEDVKEASSNDCEYFISRLVKYIDWNV
ncbi:hypothetical protein [Clostridium culturomicium]|uniref:hypothetical protein n=1 Tax=Clostridium culturomicium TaxID=1499683 RepID=UPI00058EEE8E|nr:hypothetical protein [Clostridium culturomicium]